MSPLLSEVVPKPPKGLQDESYGPRPSNQAVKPQRLPSRPEHLTHGGRVAPSSPMLSFHARSIFVGAACH